MVYAEFVGTSGDAAAVTVYWYKYDKTASATPTTVTTSAVTATDAVCRMQALIAAPADARWAWPRPWPYSGSANAIYFQTVKLKEMLPLWKADMSGDQAVASQGTVTVRFDTVSGAYSPPATDMVIDATGDFDVANYRIDCKRGGLYRASATVVVYSALNEECASGKLDLYDTYASQVVERGVMAGVSDTGQLATFHVAADPIYVTSLSKFSIRYHAFGACTIKATGSHFRGRSVI